MKIEIELQEIESIKKGNDSLKKEIEKLKIELKSLDKEELRKQAVDLSRQMFENVVHRVFKELGFEKPFTLSNDINFRQLEHWLGKDWWVHQDLEVEIGATITNKFKRAFLKLGIKTEND